MPTTAMVGIFLLSPRESMEGDIWYSDQLQTARNFDRSHPYGREGIVYWLMPLKQSSKMAL